ncbi:hypothetical protein CB0101_02460 [Synechococcus sp. CB0101]|uniref:hypothetical protein n=1 Tax=Synechococcus sp. CB0101 TaxID=232348 RepID=UPI0002001566|nr:hypothetical protein [Synechococcus sp. CB0101]QCH13942.1 hypothetical protein CB0101_02460 [Synechococcus sp. CB0101]
MAFLCQLHVHTGAGVTTMVMHAQSHAQAQLAAQELFPACRVVVIALEPPLRGTNSRPPQSAVLNNTASTEAAMLE